MRLPAWTNQYSMGPTGSRMATSRAASPGTSRRAGAAAPPAPRARGPPPPPPAAGGRALGQRPGDAAPLAATPAEDDLVASVHQADDDASRRSGARGARAGARRP